LRLIEPFKTEKLVKAWFGPFLWIFCLNPEDVKIVLNSADCTKKPRIIYSSLADFALLTMNGEMYKAHRKAITPLFTPKSLKLFTPLIDEVANEFLADFDTNMPENSFDISHYTLDFALNSIFRTFLNIDDINRATRTELLEHYAA
jgi:cytochrome P450